jgi:haloacetate dehalogenase
LRTALAVAVGSLLGGEQHVVLRAPEGVVGSKIWPTSVPSCRKTPRSKERPRKATSNEYLGGTREFEGFERFALCGHDRGGRVGYRMVLDHPGVVTKLAVLDIVPTWEAFSRADMAFGLSYWHWFFLAQPFDLPERLLATDLEKTLFRGGSEAFAPEAMEEYVRCLRDPETVHATCEAYRAPP